MLRNKKDEFVNHSNEIDPKSLSFELTSPPKEIVRNIPFSVSIYHYKFNTCKYCNKYEISSSCCSGKKRVGDCIKLGFTQFSPADCLFCPLYEPNANN